MSGGGAKAAKASGACSKSKGEGGRCADKAGEACMEEHETKGQPLLEHEYKAGHALVDGRT